MVQDYQQILFELRVILSSNYSVSDLEMDEVCRADIDELEKIVQRYERKGGTDCETDPSL